METETRPYEERPLMSHLHNTEPTELPAHVRDAIDQAQHLAETGDRHSTRSWEIARHVGDLSALASIALAQHGTLAARPAR